METKQLNKKELMLEQPKVFRINKDTNKKIQWILVNHRDKFDNESHLFRCAIIKLYNELKNAR